MIECPETSLITNSGASQGNVAPLSFILTEFHALLLYVDHVKGISLWNQELVFEDIYNEVGSFYFICFPCCNISFL